MREVLLNFAFFHIFKFTFANFGKFTVKPGWSCMLKLFIWSMITFSNSISSRLSDKIFRKDTFVSSERKWHVDILRDFHWLYWFMKSKQCWSSHCVFINEMCSYFLTLSVMTFSSSENDRFSWIGDTRNRILSINSLEVPIVWLKFLQTSVSRIRIFPRRPLKIFVKISGGRWPKNQQYSLKYKEKCQDFTNRMIFRIQNNVRCHCVRLLKMLSEFLKFRWMIAKKY